MPDLLHSDGSSQNWKVVLAYDGTDFRGWQVQPGEATVQGELQDALHRVVGESPLPQGSGRTDAGVHALAQVASFALRAPIPSENMVRALNRTLPDSIRVLDARPAPASFHARHSARAKTYEYRVFLERTEASALSFCSPFISRYVYACSWNLDLDSLQDAAGRLLGEHDFTSFAAADPDLAIRNGDVEPTTSIRTLSASDWEPREGGLFVYRVRGSGFLHHMVRNLVGTMIDVGRGYLKADDLPDILSARSRAAAGPTAPARGLFLRSVEYGGADELRP